jgi:hypothetical protein
MLLAGVSPSQFALGVVQYASESWASFHGLSAAVSLDHWGFGGHTHVLED